MQVSEVLSIEGSDTFTRPIYAGNAIATVQSSGRPSAAVKAESDLCCTSGNAVAVVKSLNAPRVLMIPDEFLAQNVQAEIPEVEILTWAGHCEVHERFTPADIRDVRDVIANTLGAVIGMCLMLLLAFLLSPPHPRRQQEYRA